MTTQDYFAATAAGCVGFWKVAGELFGKASNYQAARFGLPLDFTKGGCPRGGAELANQVMLPLIGTKSHHVQITEADYIELVDFTGREMRPGKRGKIAASEPRALTKLGLDKNHWRMRVRGIGSGYWRVVGEVDDLVDKAKELGQRTMFGTGFARFLKALWNDNAGLFLRLQRLVALGFGKLGANYFGRSNNQAASFDLPPWFNKTWMS
jgi:hypothetical protein